MKKFLSLLVVLCAMVVLPMGAQALKLDTKNACDKSCPDKETGRCTQTCRIKIAENSTPLNELDITLKYGTGVSIKSVTAGDGWTNLNGTKPTMKFMASPAVNTKDFTLATVVFDVENATTDCSINVSLEGASYTIEVEDTTQVKTGANLPLAIVGCGAAAAVVIYLATKKNKKMYKI